MVLPWSVVVLEVNLMGVVNVGVVILNVVEEAVVILSVEALRVDDTVE